MIIAPKFSDTLGGLIHTSRPLGLVAPTTSQVENVVQITSRFQMNCFVIHQRA